MTRFSVSELVEVGFDRCDFCGAVTPALTALRRSALGVGDVDLRSAYEPFEHPFGKSACRACIHNDAYLDGRSAKPPSLVRAKIWEVAVCTTCAGAGKCQGTPPLPYLPGKAEWETCRVCFGRGKLYDDGKTVEPGLALPERPIEDWESITHAGLVLHATEPRALWCARRWSYWYPARRFNADRHALALAAGWKRVIWLEVEASKPFFRVYEVSFGAWLDVDALERGYGSEWAERLREVERDCPDNTGPCIEVALRVPTEILQ